MEQNPVNDVMHSFNVHQPLIVVPKECEVLASELANPYKPWPTKQTV